ncbi:conserved hypothetical protein [uncultured Desulfatiglans sp.]|nr:conserved hypothetical protein [uncultured Desulfatiglans sp.]
MESEKMYKKAYDLHYNCKNYEEALNLYRLLLDKYPDSDESIYAKQQIQNIDEMSPYQKIDYKYVPTATDKKPYDDIILTTAPFLENYHVVKTIRIVTSECVFGMNIFRDFFASLTDFFGGRSEAAQKVLKDAREVCLSELKSEAYAVGANAVIAIDLDYSEFSGQGKSMLFLVASGTAVKVKKKKDPGENILQKRDEMNSKTVGAE